MVAEPPAATGPAAMAATTDPARAAKMRRRWDMGTTSVAVRRIADTAEYTGRGQPVPLP
jgi:Flp pilus assembly protein CpaB